MLWWFLLLVAKDSFPLRRVKFIGVSDLVLIDIPYPSVQERDTVARSMLLVHISRIVDGRMSGINGAAAAGASYAAPWECRFFIP